MRSKIEIGSKVTVMWSDGVEVSGVLVKRPQDVGDTFSIQRDDGGLLEWNPNCVTFDCINEQLRTNGGEHHEG